MQNIWAWRTQPCSQKVVTFVTSCVALKSTSESQALILVTRHFCHFGFCHFHFLRVSEPLVARGKSDKSDGFSRSEVAAAGARMRGADEHRHRPDEQSVEVEAWTLEEGRAGALAEEHQRPGA